MTENLNDEWLKRLETGLSAMELIEEHSSRKFTVRATADLYEKIGRDSLAIVSNIKDTEIRKLAEKTIEVWSNPRFSQAYFLKQADNFTDRILFLFWEEVGGDLDALEVILLSGSYDSKVDIQGIGGRTNRTEWFLKRMRDPTFIENYNRWVKKGNRDFDPSTAHHPAAKFIGPSVLLLIVLSFYFITR